MIVGQSGHLQYETLLFAASLRAQSPDFPGKLFVATPSRGPKWYRDPAIRNTQIQDALDRLDATVLPFETREFGETSPYGNKIEALLALPENESFVFSDTATPIAGDPMSVPFDFDRPSASPRCEGTFPEIDLYGPSYSEIWQSFYDKFGLDFASSLDLTQPDEYWRRYLYFNAGFFYYRCPHIFGQRFLDYATAIRDAPPAALICQSLDPWLDRIALPLVIHALGSSRGALPQGYLDGCVSCHYPLFRFLCA